MANPPRKKITTKVNPQILAAVRDLARNEGRQLQDLMGEALFDLVEKYKHGRPCASVMTAYQVSHTRYADLYKKLAE